MPEADGEARSKETVLPTVSLAGPRPGRIADLASLLMDLEYVGRLARLAGRPQPDDADDDTNAVTRALWEAALIGYRRCVNQGKGHLENRRSRRSVDDEIARLDDDLRRAHAQFIGHADRHVAHRVNDLQQVQVFAVLAAPPAPPAVEGIGRMLANFVGPTKADATLLRQLCDVLAGRLEADLDAASAELREECSGRLRWCYENASPRQPGPGGGDPGEGPG